MLFRAVLTVTAGAAHSCGPRGITCNGVPLARRIRLCRAFSHLLNLWKKSPATFSREPSVLDAAAGDRHQGRAHGGNEFLASAVDRIGPAFGHGDGAARF